MYVRVTNERTNKGVNINNKLIRHIAASTHFGKVWTVKNVTLTWYRLSNVTVYSFHTFGANFFFKFKNLG